MRDLLGSRLLLTDALNLITRGSQNGRKWSTYKTYPWIIGTKGLSRCEPLIPKGLGFQSTYHYNHGRTLSGFGSIFSSCDLTIVRSTPNLIGPNLHFRKLFSTFENVTFDRNTVLNANNPSPVNVSNSAHNFHKNDQEEPRSVAYWYLFSCILVFATVAIGGLTRLTESGLSIVEWNVIKGIKAPSSDEEWEKEFEKYKMYPEYHVLNSKMNISEFKKIFYMEWLHRNLGRIVGGTFVAAALYFAARGRLSRRLKITTLSVATLIGCQGLLGWLMVRTGLREELRTPGEVPRVDAKWLAAHLGSALIIYSVLLYTAMDILQKRPKVSISPDMRRNFIIFQRSAAMTAVLVFVTALSGALVAGLDAGLIYSEFPYMGGRIIPEDMWNLTSNPPVGKKPESWWVNLYKNPTTVQFDHRLLGTTTTLATTSLWLYARRLPLPRQIINAAAFLPLISLLQASLGVVTLIYHVPVCVATIHQSGSLVLLSFSLWLLSNLKKFR